MSGEGIIWASLPVGYGLGQGLESSEESRRLGWHSVREASGTVLGGLLVFYD